VPVGSQPVCRGRPLLLRFSAPAPAPGSATCRAFVHTLPNGISYDVASTWLISYPPAFFSRRKLLPRFRELSSVLQSNRRFPYLGFSGNFRSSNYTFRFLVSICPTGDIGRHTPSQGSLSVPSRRRAPCVMTSLQHYFFWPTSCHIVFRVKSLVHVYQTLPLPMTETASSCSPQLSTPTTLQ